MGLLYDERHVIDRLDPERSLFPEFFCGVNPVWEGVGGVILCVRTIPCFDFLRCASITSCVNCSGCINTMQKDTAFV
ncbi:unnamed protein product [Choristocarpus tenellus]